jgi:4-hydroxy-3-methylbut-2-en-1-yl diphosphate reductase
MMEGPQGAPDVMLVIGGYNSSNTNHLAVICARHTRTYHVCDANRIDPESGAIRHKPTGTPAATPEEVAQAWLPAGEVSIGVTAGASTPNNKIGEAVERVLRMRGIEMDWSV